MYLGSDKMKTLSDREKRVHNNKIVKHVIQLRKEQIKDIIYNLPMDLRQRTVNYHIKIYECIRDKKSNEAAEYMNKHMERAYRYYKSLD